MRAPSTLDISDAEYTGRRAAALSATADRGLAGLVVWSTGNTALDRVGDVLYLCGHHTQAAGVPDSPHWRGHGSAVLVLTERHAPILVTSALDDPDGRTRVSDVRVESDVPRAVATALRETGLAGQQIGLVGRALSHYDALALTTELGAPPAFTPVDDLLDALRAVKSPAEIDLIRHAVRVGCGAMDTLMAAVKPGVTDADLAGQAAAYVHRHGGRLFDLAIASGPDCEHYWGVGSPGHWNSHRPLEEGDLLHADLWTPIDAYWTDFIRSSVVGGQPTTAQERVLEAPIALCETIIAAIRPGRTFGELYDVGAEWRREHGWVPDGDAAFFDDVVPLFGHSLGLSCEPPFISPGAPEIVQANMVLCVEAGVALRGVGAAWFEHVVLVGQDTVEILDASCPDRPWLLS